MGVRATRGLGGGGGGGGGQVGEGGALGALPCYIWSAFLICSCLFCGMSLVVTLLYLYPPFVTLQININCRKYESHLHYTTLMILKEG